MSKKVKIKIIGGCRVDGESRIPGKSYMVTIEGAKLAIGARRAIYDRSPAKKNRNKNSNKEDSPPENPESTPENPESEDPAE